VTRLGALTLASEICDWRRFPRAGRLRALCGLVPGEYSNGGSTRRGHITKTGNAHLRVQLVESAWAYQHGPAVGIALRERQRVQVPSHGTRAELRGSVRGMLREQQLRD
jgi:transposase